MSFGTIVTTTVFVMASLVGLTFVSSGYDDLRRQETIASSGRSGARLD